MDPAFCIISKKIDQARGPEGFLLCFLHSFPSKSMFHLESNFIQGMMFRPILFLFVFILPMDIQLFQFNYTNHFWKAYISCTEFFVHVSHKSVVWGYFWVLYPVLLIYVSIPYPFLIIIAVKVFVIAYKSGSSHFILVYQNCFTYSSSLASWYTC